jgi:hypothetical protein
MGLLLVWIKFRLLQGGLAAIQDAAALGADQQIGYAA